MKIFDILVFTDGADGRAHQRRESGLKASSRQELINLYAMTGERIQIISESDDGTEQTTSSASSPALNSTDKTDKQVEIKPTNVQTVQQKINIDPPKFFKIGSVECKYENGKVFQKQWVRITSDSNNFRLVSDSTNKIIPLTGKHLERLTWVVTEDDAEEPQVVDENN